MVTAAWKWSAVELRWVIQVAQVTQVIYSWATGEPGSSCSHILGEPPDLCSVKRQITGKAVGHVRVIIHRPNLVLLGNLQAPRAFMLVLPKGARWSSGTPTCNWHSGSPEMPKVYWSAEFGLGDWKRHSHTTFIPFPSSFGCFWKQCPVSCWLVPCLVLVTAVDRRQCPASIPLFAVEAAAAHGAC